MLDGQRLRTWNADKKNYVLRHCKNSPTKNGHPSVFDMLCVIPFHAGDRSQAIQLAQWMKDLGGVKHHPCLLVVDKGTMKDGVVEPLEQAFKSVTVIYAEPAGQQGEWGKGTTDATAANEMFLTAATYIQEVIKTPWALVEPDATPMRATWLDELEAEYLRGGKPFMGAYVNVPPHEPHMSGNGVYPAVVALHSLDMMRAGKIAWDYQGRHDTVGGRKAHFTNLIQHDYRVHGAPATFPTIESLSIIKPETALYHRCKDGTLIERLREKTSVCVSGLNVSTSRDVQEPEGRHKTPPDWPGGSTPSTEAYADLVKRVEALERAMFVAKLNEHDRAVERALVGLSSKNPHSKSQLRLRTPERIASDKARMAKVRAGRAKK